MRHMRFENAHAACVLAPAARPSRRQRALPLHGLAGMAGAGGPPAGSLLLLVTGLPPGATEEDVRRDLDPCTLGPELCMPRFGRTGACLGFALCTVADDKAARMALKAVAFKV
jgi:hypothetical protein